MQKLEQQVLELEEEAQTKAPFESLDLPIHVETEEIRVIKKHGHLFEDEDSIKEAIVLGFSTQSAVQSDAAEKICD